MEKARNNKQNVTEQEIEGLKEMKAMNQEFLGSGEGSKAVRDFLVRAGEDEELLLRFLRGRKHRPKHAWETVKRYAETRFDTCPESFPAAFPKEGIPLIENNILGILKHRDSQGRMIGFFNANEWDTEKYPMPLLQIVAVHMVERLLLHEDSVNNGIIFIQECSGMGMKHAQQYTLNAMLGLLNIFWYSFPLKLKGVYYTNVPYVLTFLYGIIKPFLPKKLKERFLISSSGKKFTALHERISPDILPKCFGGKLENHEACDQKMMRLY